MKTLPTLDKIKPYFWTIHIGFVKTFVGFMCCILQKGTVNLNICKTVLGPYLDNENLPPKAAYKRLERFFSQNKVVHFCLGMSYFMFSLLSGEIGNSIYLAMDRTNWTLGKTAPIPINALTLGAVLPNGCFVPFLWRLLAKKGNTNMKERKAFLDLFVSWFMPFLEHRFKDKDFILLADREFIGREWFAHITKTFSFVIRVRKDDYLVEVAQALNTTVAHLEKTFKHRIKRDGFVYVPIELAGKPYIYVVLPNKKKTAKDKYVRFVTTLTDLKAIKTAYYERWQIEVFFKHCKTNGFNLEDLNLRKPEKIMLMIGVVGCAYVLAIMKGMLIDKAKPIKQQFFKSAQKSYRRVSIFKTGHEWLQHKIFSAAKLLDFIILYLKPIKHNALIITINTTLGKRISIHGG